MHGQIHLVGMYLFQNDLMAKMVSSWTSAEAMAALKALCQNLHHQSEKGNDLVARMNIVNQPMMMMINYFYQTTSSNQHELNFVNFSVQNLGTTKLAWTLLAAATTTASSYSFA